MRWNSWGYLQISTTLPSYRQTWQQKILVYIYIHIGPQLDNNYWQTREAISYGLSTTNGDMIQNGLLTNSTPSAEKCPDPVWCPHVEHQYGVPVTANGAGLQQLSTAWERGSRHVLERFFVGSWFTQKVFYFRRILQSYSPALTKARSSP